MPVQSKALLLVATLLIVMTAAGCSPTSEISEISALSQNFTTPAEQVDPPEVSEVPTVFPSAAPTPIPSVTATAIPSPQPSLLPPFCEETKGTFLSQEMKSTFLKQPLKLRVYLPPCFSASSPQPYPLLILLHGSIFTNDQWDRLGIDETADRLISEGTIQPLLIVLPYEEQTLANPYQPGFGPTLTSELVPWLEEQFPVCSERACRAIGGISRGAAWAVHLGFTQWQLFGSIGAHSLPPFWGDLNNLPLWLSSIPKEDRPRVFMDVGQGDPYRQPASQFEQFLTDNNISHEWYLFSGSHDETYWSSHVEQYLKWYSAAWDQE